MRIKDGDWTLLSYDYQTGRSVWVIFDGKKTHCRIDYPVAEIVKENLSARNEASSGWKGDWHRVASIPLNIAHNSGLVEAQKDGDDKYVKKFLNSSDNRDWRTKEGNL